MNFQHDPNLSMVYKKPTYTYTKGSICYLLMPIYRNEEKRHFRKTGKTYWYVKVGRVDTQPYLQSMTMLTTAEAVAWADAELFPTRISLLFDDV